MNVIVSLTSHTRERLNNVGKYLFASIFRHHLDGVHVVLTIYKDDINNIPADLHKMIKTGLVELIIADMNLRCHLKYFYAMKKYRNVPIITIDDDSIYPPEMIPDMLQSMIKYPGCIIGRSGYLLNVNKSYINNECVNIGVDRIESWGKHANEPRMDLNLEGYGGILYPPDILKMSDEYIPGILDTPRADDIYLMVIENRLKVKRVVPYYAYQKLIVCTKGYDAISTKQDNVQMIDEIICRYKEDLCTLSI